MLPGPRRLTLVTSPDDCDLACDMCREHAPAAPRRVGRGRRMDPALALAVTEEAGPGLAEVVPSTMGEPLLWSGLDALAERCAERNVRLNITTNGTFPGRGAAAWAERLAPVASDIKISWNGARAATAEAIMGGLCYGAALANVKTFLAVRDRLRAARRRACSVSFQVTAREANVRELGDIVRLAAQLGVERVKVNQLQVHFPGLVREDLRRDAAARERWNGAVGEMRRAADEARADGRAVRLENAVEMPEPPHEAPRGECPFLDHEAWMLWDGRFAPCPSPAAWAGELGDFGNLALHALGEVWRGEAYRGLVTGYAQRTTCRSCSFRRAGGL
ncbi:MAG: radical SAM protein [Anaeromyxobacteraceae bacterium]